MGAVCPMRPFSFCEHASIHEFAWTRLHRSHAAEGLKMVCSSEYQIGWPARKHLHSRFAALLHFPFFMWQPGRGYEGRDTVAGTGHPATYALLVYTLDLTRMYCQSISHPMIRAMGFVFTQK